MLFVGGHLERLSRLTTPLKAQLSSQLDQVIKPVSSSVVSVSKDGNTAGSWGTLSSV